LVVEGDFEGWLTRLTIATLDDAAEFFQGKSIPNLV
jgi:hypothetical protein